MDTAASFLQSQISTEESHHESMSPALYIAFSLQILNSPHKNAFTVTIQLLGFYGDNQFLTS